jgi:predicted nuclease with TOPRIM domain
MNEAIDQTAPMPTNTTDRIDKIETEIKYFESKFMDKILTVVNDLNNLKNYCLNNGLECVNGLRQENTKLKEENNALKDSLHTAKYALSDLNYKVKDLENEKASLTTTLKILYQHSHQPYEYCSKRKDANVDLHSNCLKKTKSVMTQIDSDIIHSQSRLIDEPIIACA